MEDGETMEKLTDAEIKKALECCSKAQCEQDCVVLGCPYYLEEQCSNKIVVDALDLINRKDEEIERLKAEIRNTDNALASLDRPLIEIKSEAYKEFAERLKGKALVPYGCLSVVCGCDIDNALKELTKG